MWLSASTELSGLGASPTEVTTAISTGVTPRLHTWPELGHSGFVNGNAQV